MNPLPNLLIIFHRLFKTFLEIYIGKIVIICKNMNKTYNSTQKKLILPEYGRHIQQMVDYLKTIQDREVRNFQAKAVVAVMGNLNSGLRDNIHYTHKLWDHLFIMADFDLDVDSPYPIPSRSTLAVEPKQLKYSRSAIRKKHYGKYLPRMVRSLEGLEDKAVVERSVGNIARYMRSKSFEYNQDHPDNSVIIKDIKNMSESVIEMDEAALNSMKSDYKNVGYQPQKKGTRQNYGKQQQQNKTGQSRYRTHYQRKG